MQQTTPVLPAPTPSESSCPHPLDSTSLVPNEPVTKRPRCTSHNRVGTDVAAADCPAVQTTSPALPSQDSGSHNQQPPVVASDSVSDTSKVKFTEGGCMMHKTRWHDSKTVRSTVSDGISYLDILASQAEKGTREVSTEIDEALEELKSFLVKKIDCKIARLKAQAQRNMTMSLTQLKSLNTATFKGTQRVFYPKERAHNLLGDTFTDIAREIFIVQGTHILDLPIAVLVHVVEYLKPRSWGMLRTVCFKFWKAVCELTRTGNITLSTAVQWEHEEWKLVGGDTVVTPTGDFEFKVVSTPEDITVGP
ncbi:hypothetical protein Pelo_18972 [Pelomyxa schiedti]|nr:hypothetical protein Pelo_18972 [Pelomyxa schiedti]